MKAEMENSFGYAKYERGEKYSHNIRNGSYPKTIRSGFCDIELSVPRDRNGEYSPIIVSKGVQNIIALEGKVIAMLRIAESWSM